MLDVRYLTLSYIFLPVTPQKFLVTSFFSALNFRSPTFSKNVYPQNFFRHLAESPGHTVSFEDVKILSFESHTRKRRILESIFIQESKFKLLNDNLRSIPL